MKRLIVLVLVAATVWYGWKHYGDLRGTPANEVVIENASGRTLGRLRLSIGDQEYPAYDSLYDGKSVTQRFPLATKDAQFHLHWALQLTTIEPSWSGGEITAGPIRVRHHLQILPDNSVMWSSTLIPATDK